MPPSQSRTDDTGSLRHDDKYGVEETEENGGVELETPAQEEWEVGSSRFLLTERDTHTEREALLCPWCRYVPVLGAAYSSRNALTARWPLSM
jgi:hypothetical protein